MSLYTHRGYNDVCRGKQNVYILSDPAGENNGVCQEHESSSVMRDISGFDLSFTDVIIYPPGI